MKDFLRFILPEDTETVDMEVMTLKGLYIFRQDKHSNEKTFIPWSEDHKPPSSFLMRLRETLDKPSRDFLQSVVDKNLEPSYRPRHYCTCPKVAKLSDIQVIHDAQEKHMGQMDSTPIRNAQDRPPKPSRRPSYHSDWNDSDGNKDNQARAPITSTPEKNPQPRASYVRENTPLARPNTYPKVFTFGRGNMAPLGSWNNISSGWGCRLNINYTPQVGIPNVAVVSPDKITHTDCVQTYDEMPAPVRPRHALANWTSIRIGNNPNRPLVNETPHGNSHK